MYKMLASGWPPDTKNTTEPAHRFLGIFARAANLAVGRFFWSMIMVLEKVSLSRPVRFTKTGKPSKNYCADYRCSFCGSVVERLTSNAHDSASCGCVTSSIIREKSTRHGMAFTKVHRAWSNIKNRCQNPNNKRYADYGGRGIRVCDRWQVFETFFEDMGHPPHGNSSIDRIDVNGNYEPGNCRWADNKTQTRNTRRNRIITINGVSRCVAEWADQEGAVSAAVIYLRLRRGWDAESAVFGSKHQNAVLTIDGVSMKVSEWSAQPKAANRILIYKRLRKGWSHKECVFGKFQERKDKQ